jgi:hypothetical protein
MEELIDYTNDNLHNLDKNMLVDTLKHTSDIMTALSSKIYIMEEEIKNIQEQLNIVLSLSNENKLLKEKSVNENFDKLYKTNQNIDVIYDNENDNKLNNVKQETKDLIKKNLEVKKEEVSGNVINNRKKNNLFIRKI